MAMVFVFTTTQVQEEKYCLTPNISSRRSHMYSSQREAGYRYQLITHWLCLKEIKCSIFTNICIAFVLCQHNKPLLHLYLDCMYFLGAEEVGVHQRACKMYEKLMFRSHLFKEHNYRGKQCHDKATQNAGTIRTTRHEWFLPTLTSKWYMTEHNVPSDKSDTTKKAIHLPRLLPIRKTDRYLHAAQQPIFSSNAGRQWWAHQ